MSSGGLHSGAGDTELEFSQYARDLTFANDTRNDVSDAVIEVEDLVVRYDSVAAVKGVSFSVQRGEHLTLLGPSGCGKTTILRAIAGLETPYGGEIRINGKVVYSAARRINVPTEKRNLSMVFQTYAIWPHMTVSQNVAYGLKVRGEPKTECSKKTEAALGLVRMTEFAHRSATELSGGQQQRVALARALAVSPSVLLLDEPLSNLDARLRVAMRLEIQALQKQIGVSSVYVTHDQEEAFVISDRIIVMNGGTIVQTGTPIQIYDQPYNAFVADFVGAANLIGGVVRHDLGGADTVVLETAGGQLVHGVNPGHTLAHSGSVAIRTVYLQLARDASPSEPNRWTARVKQRAFLGDAIEYILDWHGRDLVARRPVGDVFAENEEVHITVEPSRCVLLAGE
jgi:ABC-type Fe3+/spermidine/putrescine transport system ATPase subunit